MEFRNNTVESGQVREEPRIKEEHFNQDEITTESLVSLVQQNETHFVACVQNSDVDTKVGVKQETWNPNVAIKSEPELPHTFLGTGTIKADNEIDIKEDLWWCEGTSADSMNEGKESASKKNESTEEMPLLQSSRLCSDAINASQLQENNNSSTLSAKTNTQAQEHKTKFRCKTCKKFKLHSQLKRQYLVHKECKCRKYKCEICEKNFKQLAHLKKHLLIHDEQRQYKCEICEKTFKQLPYLKTHLLIHDNKRVYKCKICEKSFKQSSYLKTHLLIHDDTRQYRCEICDRSFKQLPYLKQHLLVHDNLRQYKCQICEKSFNRLFNLKTHVLIHDDIRQYKCEICEKSFKQLSGLKTHLLVHGDKRQFKCEICAKPFRRSQHLKSHLLMHDDRKQHKCELCDKRFKHVQSLKYHLMVHND